MRKIAMVGPKAGKKYHSASTAPLVMVRKPSLAGKIARDMQVEEVRIIVPSYDRDALKILDSLHNENKSIEVVIFCYNRDWTVYAQYLIEKLPGRVTGWPIWYAAPVLDSVAGPKTEPRDRELHAAVHRAWMKMLYNQGGFVNGQNPGDDSAEKPRS